MRSGHLRTRRTYGAETDFVARVTPIFRMEAGVGLLHARYSKIFFTQDFFPLGPTAPLENVNGRVIPQEPTASGNAAPNSSVRERHSVNTSR